MAIVRHLVIAEHGVHLGKHSERLQVTRIKSNEVLEEAPLLHLDAVVIGSRGVSLSADAVQVCAERGIPIHFVSGTGVPYASLYSAGLTGTIATRRAQLEAYRDERGVNAAKAFVHGKLSNQANLLRYMAKYRKEREPELYETLQRAVTHILEFGEVVERTDGACVEEVRETLLGLEGQAAQVYWDMVRLLLKGDLDWPGRQTRGASDVFNQALNYGYGVLYGQVERALVLAGLDPFAGFLHADRPGKPSLVLDLIEEFRQMVVDRTLIGLVNKGVKIGQEERGGLALETRRLVAERVLERLDSPVPFEGQRMALRNVLQTQARHLATFLRGERVRYEPFVGGW